MSQCPVCVQCPVSHVCSEEGEKENGVGEESREWNGTVLAVFGSVGGGGVGCIRGARDQGIVRLCKK